jgi:hydrogenase expression/formation protein HypE
MPHPPRFDDWTCPLPLRDFSHVVLGHGGGGRLSADLFEHLILPALANPILQHQTDAAVLPPMPGRLAVSTDSYVVRPLFFPGGSIAELAVHGTVNDLAMMGAVPNYLTCSLVLEEGLPLATLAEIVRRVGLATRAVGVHVVAGDTKIIERGTIGEGCMINTTGIGCVADDISLSPTRVEPGDILLLSGTVAEHGVAVLSQREGLEFESEIVSDTAPLHELVQALLAAVPVRFLRDPTRGGVATTLNELVRAGRFGVEIEEKAVPILPAVASACDLLGLDPLTVANEGKFLAVVPADAAGQALEVLRNHPLGRKATRIGCVVGDHPGYVVARTAFGTSRIISMPTGELLPRIC